jgi:hypothetical protein
MRQSAAYLLIGLPALAFVACSSSQTSSSSPSGLGGNLGEGGKAGFGGMSGAQLDAGTDGAEMAAGAAGVPGAPSAGMGGVTATAGGASGAGEGGAGGESSSACSVDGNPGTCEEVSTCAALPGYTATPGSCPDSTELECCTKTPNIADNPPVPPGWKLMTESEVTVEMTNWADGILHAPTDYPLFSSAMQTFGTLTVLLRVEWHPPDFQNDVVHRGVTLYEPS